MAREFSLAGLLRLRQLEQDVAASELGAANTRLSAIGSRRVRARTALGSSGSAPGNIVALHAVAAARASARSMLAELEAVERYEAEAVVEARARLDAARARAIGIEKLADKHTAAIAKEDVRTEQSIIDELASTAWHRTHHGSTE